MKTINYILISIFIISTSILMPNNWSLQINTINYDSSIPGDAITMGVCDGCNDGFQYNEDEVDLSGSPIDMTDIHFTNPSWLGEVDTNGVPCEWTSYSSDYKSIHEPSDLLIWDITGTCADEVQDGIDIIQFNWVVDTLSQDYEIYMYLGDNGINMRYTTSTQISCDIVSPAWDMVDGEFVIIPPSIKILMGGCASTGLSTFYLDNDGDGLGSNTSSEFCAGFQSTEWVNNSDDLDDSIFCESNNFDTCWICDGYDYMMDCAEVCDPSTPIGSLQEDQGLIYGAFIDECGICSSGSSNHAPNSDQDCNEECFGYAFIDDCGVCSGGNTEHEANSDQDCAGECFGNGFFDYCNECNGYNLSCLELIFGEGPSDLYAQIDTEANQIHLTWIYNDINISNQIIGYKIYEQINDEIDLVTVIESSNLLSYSIDGYSEGIFCLTAFDTYNNETDAICSEASEFSNFMFSLTDGANLISFPYLSNEDASVGTIFNSLTDDIDGIISEGIASSYNSFLDMWQGTVQEIERRKGYWIKMNLEDEQSVINFSVSGIETDHNTVYSLHDGANLVSYVGIDSVAIGDAIPDDIEDLFEAIIGEGVAATPNPVLGWVGSLDKFILGNGYWLKIDPNITTVDMVWNSDNSRTDYTSFNEEIKSLNEFNFNQSTLQAFYFIENITVNTLTLDQDDIIMSYCNEVLTGARYYCNQFTDVPAMGQDGDKTIGYCNQYDVPLFKLFDNETGRTINLTSDYIPQWENLGIFFISLEESSDIYHPEKTQLVSVYPNPFNPTAKINFEINKAQEVSLLVYGIDGRLVDVLKNEKMEMGSHTVTWDSNKNPSGIYIIRLTTKEESYSSKIFLIK